MQCANMQTHCVLQVAYPADTLRPQVTFQVHPVTCVCITERVPAPCLHQLLHVGSLPSDTGFAQQARGLADGSWAAALRAYVA